MKLAAFRLNFRRTFILSLASFVAAAAFITLAVSASRNATTDPTPGNNTGTATTTVITLISLTVNDTGDAADLVLDGICDTNAAPGDQCTLRAAIQETNNAPIDDNISFSLPPTSIITLDTELPAINSNLIITGPAANLLTVQRRLEEGTPDFRVFTINSGTTVTISGDCLKWQSAGR